MNYSLFAYYTSNKVHADGVLWTWMQHAVAGCATPIFVSGCDLFARVMNHLGAGSVLSVSMDADLHAPPIDNEMYASILRQLERGGYEGLRQALIGDLLYIGLSPDGHCHLFRNQTEFAREYGLKRGSISRCLRGTYDSTDGWTFRYIT